MSKIRPADTKVDDLNRDELLWLAKMYFRPSHRMVCEARLHGLGAARSAAFDAYTALQHEAISLAGKTQETLERATAKMEMTHRARSMRWAAHENAQSAERRARDKAEAAYRRYTALGADQDALHDHLDQLDGWVR